MSSATARAPDDDLVKDEEKAQLLDDDPLASGVHKLSLHGHSKSSSQIQSLTVSSNAGFPRHQVLWILSTSISLSSSRFILITKNFHYPMILLVWQLAATVLTVSLHLFVGKRLSSHGQGADARDPSAAAAGFPVNLRALVSVALAAVALPVTYQAILHFPNVASLAMFSIHAVAVTELFRLVILNLASQLRSRARPSAASLRVLLVAAGCVLASYLMFASDYRLTSRGDRSLIVATYLTAGAQTFLTFGNHRHRRALIALDSFQLALTCGALVLATLWYFPFEGPYNALQFPDVWILGPNMLSTAYAVYSGGSLIVPLCEPPDKNVEDPVRFSNSLRQRLLCCFSTTGIIALSSLLLPNRGFVNMFQLTCYAATLAALFFGNASYSKFSLRGVFRSNGIGKTMTLIALLCWIAYVPLNFTDYPFGQTLPVKHPNIDRSYSTTRRFDIVVSHFDEEPSEIARLVTRITSVPAIKNLNARLFVYTKRENMDLVKLRAQIEKAFGADPQNKQKFWYFVDGVQHPRSWPHIEAVQMQNFGREGGTYMSHIVKNYYTLAQHTLFTQASVHDLEDVVGRLHYFVPGPPISTAPTTDVRHSPSYWWGRLSLKPPRTHPSPPPSPSPTEGLSTGMLPLGFTTEVCDCHRCSDIWGWHDTSPLVPQIFKTAFGLTTGQCKNIVLTYKGQFIASAQRIRGLGRDPYLGYRDALTREDRWEHSREYLEKYTGHGGVNRYRDGSTSWGKGHTWGEVDSIERPWFGYTMERMWGVLMQCSDMGIAWKCPTLKSRWRGAFGGDKGDCQCFDMVRPPDDSD